MGKVVIRSYKFRLYPSKTITGKMDKILGACRFLYNAELEYEKQAYFPSRYHANRVDLNK